MIQDNLEKILAVKADIKSALTNAGIENPGDIFTDYPDMIKSLGWINDGLRDSFFGIVSGEFISEDIIEDDITFEYLFEKWRYKFSDEIYVKGNYVRKIPKVETGIVLDVVTKDGAEVFINYIDETGKEQQIQTSQGKLELPLYKISGEFVSIDNWLDNVQIINTINTDILPGDVLDYHLHMNADRPDTAYPEFNNTLTEVNEWICKNAESLEYLLSNCPSLERVVIKTSDKVKSVAHLCDSKATTNALKYVDLQGTSGCENFLETFDHVNSGRMTYDYVAVDFTSASTIDGFIGSPVKEFNFYGKFPVQVQATNSRLNASWYQHAYNSTGSTISSTYNICHTLTGIDYSDIPYGSFPLQIFYNYEGNYNTYYSAFYNLEHCKIKGFDLKNITCYTYPYISSKWVDEDIEFTFSHIKTRYYDSRSNDHNFQMSPCVKKYFDAHKEWYMFMTGHGFNVLNGLTTSLYNYNRCFMLIKSDGTKTLQSTRSTSETAKYSEGSVTNNNIVQYTTNYQRSDNNSIYFSTKTGITDMWVNLSGHYYRKFDFSDMTDLKDAYVYGTFELSNSNTKLTFRGCSSLTSLTFDCDLTKIDFEEDMFEGCSELTEITFRNMTIPARDINLFDTNISEESIDALADALEYSSEGNIIYVKSVSEYAQEIFRDKNYTVSTTL